MFKQLNLPSYCITLDINTSTMRGNKRFIPLLFSLFFKTIFQNNRVEMCDDFFFCLYIHFSSSFSFFSLLAVIGTRRLQKIRDGRCNNTNDPSRAWKLICSFQFIYKRIFSIHSLKTIYYKKRTNVANLIYIL